MTRRELHPGVLLKEQRLITRVQDGTVFFITIARSPKDFVTRLGGGHLSIRAFVRWVNGRKPEAPKEPRVSERRKRWLAESGQEGLWEKCTTSDA